MRLLPVFLFLFAASLNAAMAAPVCPVPRAMRFEVERRIQRDVLGFTEGFEVHDGTLYESTGSLHGGTRLMRMTMDGHVSTLVDSGQSFFGEGLTFLGDRLYQLSWQDHKVFVYDAGLKLVRTMPNRREGWGMTNNGRELVFGDGSDTLFFTNPENFHVNRTIKVRRGRSAIDEINELEYVDGKIYANVWQTRRIIRINAASGCVEAEAQMDPLWAEMSEAERSYVGGDVDFVLNGIAHDSATGLFYLTGKVWPMVFAGRFVDQ